MMTTIVLLALAGTVIATLIGSVWYSPKTPMGRIHARFLGFDRLTSEEQRLKMEAAKPHMWKLYLAQMALSFLTTFFVVFVVVMSVQNGVPFTVAILFPVMGWLCFMVPTIGSSVLWSNCRAKLGLQKFFSDSLM